VLHLAGCLLVILGGAGISNASHVNGARPAEAAVANGRGSDDNGHAQAQADNVPGAFGVAGVATLTVRAATATGQALKGGCFNLYQDGGGGSRGTLQAVGCDENDGTADGAFAFSISAPGSYVVSQSFTPVGYLQAMDRKVTIASGDAALVTFKSAPAPAGAGSPGPSLGTYGVTLQGWTGPSFGPLFFTRSGAALVAPTYNSLSNNPREICLVAGDPFAQPQIGAITFLSNKICYPRSTTSGDIALVLFNPASGQARVKPHPDVSTTSFNGFNNGSSVYANVYFVEHGDMVLEFTDCG
jgi:hypothetical protein